MELARAGDPVAIEQLAEAYWPEAYRAAIRIVRSHEDAEDIAQDALLAAIMHLPTFRNDACFRTWLHRIVLNHGLMALRRRRSRAYNSMCPFRDDGLPDRLNDPRTPEQALLDAERRTLIEDSVSKLPPAYAAVLRLVVSEDSSTIEIANRMGISTGAVKTRLYRGRQELRREITSRMCVTGAYRKYRSESASMIGV